MPTYRTFKRSCTNWKQFVRGRKTTDCTGLTFEEARARCKWFNDNLSPAQKRAGTKLEFISE